MAIEEAAPTSRTGGESPAPDSVGRPWLKFYEPGVPHEIAIPDQPLHTFLSDTAARYPDRVAVKFMGASLSYRQLDVLATRWANALRNLGVTQGDRVALMLPNTPQMVFAYYGALRAGAVLVPTSPLYVEKEIQHQFADAEVKVALVLSKFFPHVQAVRPQLPHLEHVVVTNIKEYFPPVLRALFTVARERKDGHRVSLPADGRTYWLQSLLSQASVKDPQAPVTANDLALLQYTGGTTGTAKGAMLTHRNLAANSAQVRAWFCNVGRSDGADRVLGVIPLFHIYAMTTVMNNAIAAGGTMVLQPQFVLTDVLKAIQQERPDTFPGVPTMYMAINNAPDLAKYDLRSLKACISGAAPLPQEVQAKFESQTGAALVEGYGLTEASPVTHSNPLRGTRKPGSIGIPFPSTDAAIFDQETGTRRLGPGEIGELGVRGPQVMRGYWKREDETANVLRDGWLLTGDLARMDEDGYFFVVDRKKDMIITGGMKVYPRDVEEPLYRHPAVKEAVAVGIPDERWGEAVKVYIVLKDGASVTEQEIVTYCHAEMAGYKCPKFVEFRKELPKSLVGKYLRRKLLEEEAFKQATASPRT